MAATGKRYIKIRVPTPFPQKIQTLPSSWGLWDRLADECKARLIEVIRENLPSETLPTLPTSPRKVRSITPV